MANYSQPVKYKKKDENRNRLKNAQHSLKGGGLPCIGVAVARGTPQGPDTTPPVRVGPHQSDRCGPVETLYDVPHDGMTSPRSD